jgi:hypothetical protein
VPTPFRARPARRGFSREQQDALFELERELAAALATPNVTVTAPQAADVRVNVGDHVRVAPTGTTPTLLLPPPSSALGGWVFVTLERAGTFTLRAADGQVNGQASLSFAAPGLYVLRSDAKTSWWVSAFGSAGSITTAMLADGAVSTAKIADDAVTAAKVADAILDDLIPLGTGQNDSLPTFAVRTTALGWVRANGVTQAQQENPVTSAQPVTPAVQQFHPSAAKAWGVADGDGVGVPASYNIDSIDDTATGVVTINLLNDMSSANYAAVATAWRLTGQHYACGTDTHLAGSFRIVAYEVTSGAIEDPDAYSFAVYGDR